MYAESRIADTKRFLKAFASNQIARFAPRYYLKITSQTGRGNAPETAQQIADYFLDSFLEYFQRLDVTRQEIPSFLRGKILVEYGPGNLPGVAFLMYALGAESVYCVDRFPMMDLSEKNIETLCILMEGLDSEAAERARNSFKIQGDPASGFREEAIRYIVNSSGLAMLKEEVDLAISRAVLEHVNDLPASFLDMYNALRPGGLAVHKVDLKSHGLHQRNPIDFLTWPEFLWQLMYSEKGVPNRLRVGHYRKILDEVGFQVDLLEATEKLDEGSVTEVRPFLAKKLANVPADELAWLGFWLVASKPQKSQKNKPGSA